MLLASFLLLLVPPFVVARLFPRQAIKVRRVER
jgi:hypothetical protein